MNQSEEICLNKAVTDNLLKRRSGKRRNKFIVADLTYSFGSWFP